MDADRDRAEDRRTEDGRLEDRRHGDLEPRHVGLDGVPERTSGGPAADAHLGDLDAGREHRLCDVADRQRRGLDDRPGDMATAVGKRQTGKHAAGLTVPDRRPLAGEIRQEDEAVRARWRCRRLDEQGVHRDRVAEDRLAIPIERSAGRRHRCSDAVSTGERPGRHESAGHLDRTIPVDAEPARRAARVVCVARFQESRRRR